MKAKLALPALGFVAVAAYLVIASGDRHSAPMRVVDSTAETAGALDAEESKASVDDSNGAADSRRPELAVVEDVANSTVRPPLFVGEVMPEDFLRQWWGNEWPTVQTWMQKNGREIPNGPWRMDEQLLPEEADARVRETLLLLVQHKSNENEALASRMKLEEKCALPTDRATRTGDGLVQAPRGGGKTVSLTEAQFEAIATAMAPRREVLRAAYQAVMDEEARIGVEQVQNGGYHMAPFVEYFPDNCLTVTVGQRMVSSSFGIWHTRLVVDYQASPSYNALKAAYASAEQDTLKLYEQLIAAY